jgi:hypothetical protein
MNTSLRSGGVIPVMLVHDYTIVDDQVLSPQSSTMTDIHMKCEMFT